MEHIITFLPNQFSKPDIFSIEMAGITYPDSKYVIRRNHSPVHCLELVISGRGEIIFPGKTYRPAAGDAYLLAAEKNHFYRASPKEPWKKIWMNVQGALCDSLVQCLGIEDVILFPQCRLLPLFQDFLEVCQTENFGSEQEKKTQLIFHEILWALSKTAPKEESITPAMKIKHILDNHIYSSISMEKLGKEVSLSPSQLTRIFKKAYAQTPYDYLLTQKLSTARLLLTSTSLPIKEIAYRLQFADEHYFSNLFKGKAGCSPLQYRRGQQPSP